jgi:hypothetical protein
MQTIGSWTTHCSMIDQWVNDEIKEEIKRFLEVNEN